MCIRDRYKLERAELAIALPADWKLVQESMQDERWYWPIPVSYTHLRAAASNESEAKWQFAAYLPECSCSQKVRDIILDFAKDPNDCLLYTSLNPVDQ